MGTFFDNVNREAEAYIRDCVSRTPSDSASVHVPQVAAEPPAFLSPRPPSVAHEIVATGAGYVPGELDVRDADLQATRDFSGLSTRMKDLGIGCSMSKTTIAERDFEFKTKEANVQNLQKTMRDEIDAAILGRKYQPVMYDRSNTSGGLSSEAHLESQSSNSDQPLDWKKVVLDSIAFIDSNLPVVLETNNWSEGELMLISRILFSCSEEILMLFQSKASFSKNEVVSGVSFTTIKHFFTCIRMLQSKISGPQSMNHRLNMEVDRLSMELEAVNKGKSLKPCCEDDICKCP